MLHLVWKNVSLFLSGERIPFGSIVLESENFLYWISLERCKLV